MIGPGSVSRVRAMAELSGLNPDPDSGDVVVDQHGLCVVGAGVVARPAARGRAWIFGTAGPSPRRLGEDPVGWEVAARELDVAGLVCGADGGTVLHAGVSGVQPLYVQILDDVVYFSTRSEALLRTASGPLTPDWSAWAAVLGAGAPMAGRTTVEEIRRLGPMQALGVRPGPTAQVNGRVDSRADARAEVEILDAPWVWGSVEPDPQLDLVSAAGTGLTDELIDVLRDEVAAVADRPLQPMLSGGRDSRMLTGLATQVEAGAPVTAWSTSSDIGHTLEELTGARIARVLGARQRIVSGRQDRFAQDFLDYARATGFQASFHVWLMPVARRLAEHSGTILDGLGGGVFLGGGFPDDQRLLEVGATPDSLVENRFARACKYLKAVEQLLTPEVADAVAARVWEDFRSVAEPYGDHPNGATLTAYLTRTLPGISMAPAAVLGSARPTAVPIMSHAVVSRALRVPHEVKRDGAWYPDLMERVHPEFRRIPTAADLTRSRQHKRRGAAIEAARWYRDLVLGSPAAALLGPQLADGSAEDWQRQLEVTGGQHVIRGLALLALWSQEHEARLSAVDVAALGRG